MFILQVILGHVINSLSSGVLDCSRSGVKPVGSSSLFDARKIGWTTHTLWRLFLISQRLYLWICLTLRKYAVENGLDAFGHGWKEYKHQPVLPASLAYVLLYFNIALAPGAIMTAFLVHHGNYNSLLRTLHFWWRSTFTWFLNPTFFYTIRFLYVT